MASSIENLQYHIVWSTKYRYKLLTTEMAEILKKYFLKRQDTWSYQIKSIAIEPEHIHLLIQVESSQVDLNKLIAKLKRGSSFLIRKKFRYLLSYPSLWTPSYFCASIGNVSDKTIEDYLNNQGIEEKEIVLRTFKYKVFEPTRKKARLLRRYFKACLNQDKKQVPSGILQDFERVKRKEGEFGLYFRAQLSKIEKRDNTKVKYWFRIPGSRYEKPFWLGLIGRVLPDDYKLKDSTIREKNGVYYVYLSIEQERVVKKAQSEKVVAIDLGVNHPITSVMLAGKMKGYYFYGKTMKNQIYKRSKRYAQLQSSGAEKLKERVKNYTNRIKEMIHNYTNEIVKLAVETNSSIVIGNLRGIKNIWVKGKTGKKTRRKANRIPYGRIMNQLWYKGTLANIPVVFVNEAYTSQRCSLCGSVNRLNRKGEVFKCRSCGYQNQADLNGAINIGTIALAGLLSQSHQALKEEIPNTSLCALAT